MFPQKRQNAGVRLPDLRLNWAPHIKTVRPVLFRYELARDPFGSEQRVLRWRRFNRGDHGSEVTVAPLPPASCGYFTDRGYFQVFEQSIHRWRW